jgi:phage-related protein
VQLWHPEDGARFSIPRICAQLWDLRVKRAVHTMSEEYQVLAVAFGEAGDQVYTGGIENTIKVWDLRKVEVAMTLKGHTDTVTGLRVSPDGTHLLSNAMVRQHPCPRRCLLCVPSILCLSHSAAARLVLLNLHHKMTCHGIS